MNAAPRHHRLRRYYDALSRRLWRARRRGRGEGAEALAMHRALAPGDAAEDAPPEDGGRGAPEPPSPLVLDGLIDAALPWGRLGDAYHALDAGCGYGGVALRLAERRGGRWLGRTLSPVQARTARRAARRAGLAERVRFEAKSYAAPFDLGADPFDLIVAVESLVHAPDKAAVAAHFAAALRPGGSLAIVDDMVAEGAAVSRDNAVFGRGWMAPSAPSETEWRAILSAAGFEAIATRDFTPRVRPRPEAALRRHERLARRARRRAPDAAMRAVIDGEIGGVALERLYAKGAMRYVLLLATRAPL